MPLPPRDEMRELHAWLGQGERPDAPPHGSWDMVRVGVPGIPQKAGSVGMESAAQTGVSHFARRRMCGVGLKIARQIQNFQLESRIVSMPIMACNSSRESCEL